MAPLSWIVSNVLLASLVALGAWYTQRSLRRPAIAHVLWVLVLVKLVTPPLVSFPLYDDPRKNACQNGTCGCGLHVPSTARIVLPWALFAAWSVGAVTTGWTAWRRWTWFRRLLTHAVPAPPPWQWQAARLSSELSLRCPPEVLTVPGRLPPLIVPGRHRPRMLLPADLIGQLNDPQRTVLILHELIHLRRGDHLVRTLELLVSVAYWWLPVVCLIGRQLRACEEACCDAGVVSRRPQERADYARLLLDVVDFISPLPRAARHATAMSCAGDLERRLRGILESSLDSPRRWRWVGAVAVSLACAILPCGLRCDWAGALVPLATSAAPERATAPTPTPENDRILLPLCCPS